MLSKFPCCLAELPRHISVYIPSYPVSWRNYRGIQFSCFLAELPRHLVFLFLGGTTEASSFPVSWRNYGGYISFPSFPVFGRNYQGYIYFPVFLCLGFSFQGVLFIYGKHSQHTRPSLFGICQQLACASLKIMPTCTQRLHKTKCIYQIKLVYISTPSFPINFWIFVETCFCEVASLGGVECGTKDKLEEVGE